MAVNSSRHYLILAEAHLAVRHLRLLTRPLNRSNSLLSFPLSRILYLVYLGVVLAQEI